YIFRGHFVNLDKLAEQTIVLELGCASLKVFESEEASSSSEPGIGGLGHDDVELLVSGVDKVSTVVGDEPESGILKRAMVDVIEVMRGFDDRRFELDTCNVLKRKLLH